MRTPKEYQENLDNNIITSKMLEDALYSVNKRAKNYRDAARKSRGYTSVHCEFDSNDIRKKEMYGYKEILLTCISPICIHKELKGYKRTRVFDYQKDYKDLYLKHFLSGTIIWTNYYIDGYVWSGNRNTVHFFDYIDPNVPEYQYYLYYEIGKHSFHLLIDDPNKYELPIFDIAQLETEGDDINDLLSLQFIKKLIALIKTKNFQYITNTTVAKKEYDNIPPQSPINKPCWEEIWEYVKDDVINKSLVTTKFPSDTKYSMDDVNSLIIGNRKCKQKYKVDGKRYKKTYCVPKFKYKLMLNELPIPELTDNDKAVLTEKLNDDVKYKNFVNAMLDTEMFAEYFDKYLYEKFRMNELVKRLTALTDKTYRRNPRDITKEEIIDLFFAKN